MLLPACCCGDCIIFGDLFDRADGAIGSPWVDLDGTWTIDGGMAVIASPADEDATFVHPSEYDVPGFGHWFAEAALTSSDAGDEIGIMFIGRTDNDSVRAYVTITFHDDEEEALLRIYKREEQFPPDPPLETLIRTAHITAPPGEPRVLRACRGSGNRWSFYLDGKLITGALPTEILPSFGPGGVGLIVRSVTGTPEWNYAVTGKSGTINCQCYGCVMVDTINTFTHDAPLMKVGNTYAKGDFDFVGGRLVNDGDFAPLIPDWAVLCAYYLADPLALDIETSVKIYWDSPPFDTNLNLGLRLGRKVQHSVASNNRGAYLRGNPKIAGGLFPPVSQGWTYGHFSQPGAALTEVHVPATPAQGDVLAIRVTADGTGTYTVQYKINGSVIGTETNVNIEHPDVPGNWEYGVWGTGDGYGQFDDLAIDFNP